MPMFNNKPKVLIVDDEPVNLRILGSILQQNGFDVGFANNASQALASLEYRIPDIFILDIMMPNIDGYELALQLRSLPKTESIPVIFISALNDTDSIIKGFDAGGADYITKPFNHREVVARVNNQLELKNYRESLEIRVKEQVLEIETITMTLVEVLENANYYRDDETGFHIRRVTEFSKQLAQRLAIPEFKKREIGLYASLHDIGKIGIPDSILRKPARLTEEEFEVIKKHPIIGYNILNKEQIPDTAKNIVLYHHEKWDGSGYPKQLVGNDIPIEAQVVALADMYDALRSRRVYKQPFTAEETEQIIINNANTHFDPNLIEIFKMIKVQFRAISEKYKEEIE